MKLSEFYPSSSYDTKKTDRNPSTADTGYPIGFLWVNTVTQKLFVCTDTGTSNNAVWESLSKDGSPDNIPLLPVARDANGGFAAGVINAIGITDTDYRRIVNPGGGYVSYSDDRTGAIVVKFPVLATATNVLLSLKMSINRYVYTTPLTLDILQVDIGGFLNSSSASWEAAEATIISQPGVEANYTVRFGKSADGYPLIYIGELNTVWSSCQIFITDVFIGYAGNKIEWTKGWNVSVSSAAFTNIYKTRTNTQVGTTTNLPSTVVKRNSNGDLAVGTVIVDSITDAGYRRIVNPAGGVFAGNTNSTGAISITLPAKSVMTFRIRMSVDEVPVNNIKPMTVEVAGYWNGTSVQYASGFIISNPNLDANHKIRFGTDDSGFPIIYIGELDKVWGFPQITVLDVMIGYAASSISFTKGWIIGFEATAFKSVGYTISNPQVGTGGSGGTSGVPENVPGVGVARDASGNFAAGVISATGLTDTDHKRIINPGGGTFTAATQLYGAIRITLPATVGDLINLKFTIAQYINGTAESAEISFDGSFSTVWNYGSAVMTGDPDKNFNHTIRLGVDTGKLVIYIGSIETLWSYPQVIINDVYVYSNGPAWASGWDIGMETTAFQNVSHTIPVKQIGYGAQHDSLTGISGGAIEDYQHLTTAQVSKLDNITTYTIRDINNTKISTGSSTFAANGTEKTIAHGLGGIPTFANIVPIAATDGYLGEYWVRKDATNIYVGNTGSSTVAFSWKAEIITV